MNSSTSFMWIVVIDDAVVRVAVLLIDELQGLFHAEGPVARVPSRRRSTSTRSAGGPVSFSNESSSLGSSFSSLMKYRDV